jgi:hypothetical protein
MTGAAAVVATTATAAALLPLRVVATGGAATRPAEMPVATAACGVARRAVVPPEALLPPETASEMGPGMVPETAPEMAPLETVPETRGSLLRKAARVELGGK